MLSGFIFPLAVVLASLLWAYLSFRSYLTYQSRMYSDTGSLEQNSRMAGRALVFLLISSLVFFGSFYYLFSLSKSWVPPPAPATSTPDGGLSQPGLMLTPSAPAVPALPQNTPTPSAAPGSGFARIGNTNGFGANVRSEPGLNFESLMQLSDGSRVELTGEVQSVDGFNWQRVRMEDGRVGWIADNFLILER